MPINAGPVALTPSGALAIHPHTYGRVLAWHVETAEVSWRHVAPCVGVELDVVSRFPIWLTRAPAQGQELEAPGSLHIGGPNGDHIEIIGASWDFDPANPEATPAPTAEIARLWRHEMVHLALWKRDGDPDPEHTRAEWSCQQEAPR